MTIQKLVYRNILWLSFVHGSLVSQLPVVNVFNYEFNRHGYTTLILRINELKCNPSLLLTKCVLSEMFSWVSTVTIN